jgi:Leucine-rich repeat (LRR) protein
MFRILLWIILWLSVGFAGLISSEMNMNCHYYQYSENYACQVFGEKILNKNQEISFSGDHLSGKTDNSVTKLAFYETWMYYMPTNLFSKFSKIQYFQCDGCNVKKIEKADFKQVGDLKTLKLRVGSILTLPNDLFYFCDKLESVELQANHISKIEEKAFSGLRNLKEIYLNHNFIDNLKKGTFDDLLSLEILSLRNNKIEKVVANLLEFNTNLEQIDLSYNRITLIDPNLIDHLEKLTFLGFCYNDCGDREDFYDNRPANMKSTFNQYAPQCTEENRLEYKLKDKERTINGYEYKITLLTQKTQALNSEKETFLRNIIILKNEFQAENSKNRQKISELEGTIRKMKSDGIQKDAEIKKLTQKIQVFATEKETFLNNITTLKNQIRTENLEKSNKISELEETLKKISELTQKNQALNIEKEKFLKNIKEWKNQTEAENLKQSNKISELEETLKELKSDGIEKDAEILQLTQTIQVLKNEITKLLLKDSEKQKNGKKTKTIYQHLNDIISKTLKTLKKR